MILMIYIDKKRNLMKLKNKNDDDEDKDNFDDQESDDDIEGIENVPLSRKDNDFDQFE